MTGCGQSFVREDLFLRHRSRHQRGSESVEPKDEAEHTRNTQYPDGFKIPLSPEARAGVAPRQALAAAPTPGNVPFERESVDATGNTHNLRSENLSLAQSSLYDTAGALDPTLANSKTPTALSADNFASWLFGSPDSQDPSFNPDGLPFFDSGIDWSSWDFSDTSFPLAAIPNASGQDFNPPDLELLEIAKQRPRGPDHLYFDPSRHAELCEIVERYKVLRQNRKSSRRRDSPGATAPKNPTPGDAVLPELSADVFQSCVASYWDNVAGQMPIVHQPTFSCSTSPCSLVLVMVTLGAGHIAIAAAKGSLKAYSNLANLIASGLRWEIFEDLDAHPPVKLWVAQALVLLEFYEKMYATRLLHERAHIGHSYTLNLLRRGSPMVAASGSASPQDEDTGHASPPNAGRPSKVKGIGHNDWWSRWARNESMHRVVFAAFKMDIFHAVMFGRCCLSFLGTRAKLKTSSIADTSEGHNADLAPYEIRLPLPCDESMWTAETGEEVQRLQETFAFHGFKPVNFLDALKLSLHGQEVHTHFQGRTILFAGLLSIGWHISRRERSLQFLETPRSVQDQSRWQGMLSRAFGIWRNSFEQILLQSSYRWTEKSGIDDPNLLCHFANLIMNVDIVEIQIMAQNKRLLSRKVSSRDMALATQRMRAWAATSTGRLAVFHAYRLLFDTIIEKAPARRGVSHYRSPLGYSCRYDSLVHWPWMIYLSALTVWSYEYCSMPKPQTVTPAVEHGPPDAALEYLSRSKHLVGPDGVQLIRSPKGCGALLAALALDYENAESELFVEAGGRIRHCADMLGGCA